MHLGKLEIRVSGSKICRPCRDFEQTCYAYIHLLERQPAKELKAKPTTLYPSLAALETSAKDGCDICRVWLKAILNECYSAADEKRLSDSHDPVQIEPPLAMSNLRLFDIHIVSPLPAVVKRLKGAWGSRPTLPITKDYIEDVEWLKESGDAQDNSLTVIEQDPLNMALWKRVRRWLKYCVAEHASCQADAAPAYPSRLIHVDQGSIVKLVDTAQLEGQLDYVALSYCWGESFHQTVKLSAETEGALRRGMERDQFPLTIQHAMQVCQLLEIPYLWIDALCIRQDGNGQDFADEAKRMDQIYGFAKLTVVVSSSATAAEGFLHPRRLEQYEIQARHVNFADGRLFVQRKGLIEVSVCSPVAERAWCFQEELLSRRLLYITSHGMFWSCSKVDLAEHGNHLNQSNEHFPGKDRPLTKTNPHGFTHGSDPLFTWDRMVDQYSSRNCTRREDRLLAMLGLAALVQKRTGEEFLFGLWRCRLPYQLLWVVKKWEEGVEMDRHAPDPIQGMRIPSWSWASTPPRQAVKMPHSRMSHSRARLSSVGDFANTTCLSLEGKSRMLLQNHRKLDYWPVDGSDFLETDDEHNIWAADDLGSTLFVREEGRDPILIHLDHRLNIQVHSLTCFEINYKGLLVLEHVKADGYRRVGCAQAHNDQAFFAHSPVTTINLI